METGRAKGERVEAKVELRECIHFDDIKSDKSGKEEKVQ